MPPHCSHCYWTPLKVLRAQIARLPPWQEITRLFALLIVACHRGIASLTQAVILQKYFNRQPLEWRRSQKHITLVTHPDVRLACFLTSPGQDYTLPNISKIRPETQILWNGCLPITYHSSLSSVSILSFASHTAPATRQIQQTQQRASRPKTFPKYVSDIWSFLKPFPDRGNVFQVGTVG